METKNICPKCGSKNSLFVCSMGAINCSVCCEYIRRKEEGETLVDVSEVIKIPVKNLDEEPPKSAGYLARHDPEEFDRITKDNNLI